MPPPSPHIYPCLSPAPSRPPYSCARPAHRTQVCAQALLDCKTISLELKRPADQVLKITDDLMGGEQGGADQVLKVTDDWEVRGGGGRGLLTRWGESEQVI